MKRRIFESLIFACIIILGVGILTSICDFGKFEKIYSSFYKPKLLYAQPIYQFPGGHCTGYQTLTPNSTTASALTQTSMGVNTSVAWMTIETGAIRFWVHGGAPTTSLGMKRDPTSGETTLYLDTRDKIDKFKVISISTHGTLQIQFCE